MSHAAAEKSDHPHAPPKAIVKKLRRPFFLIWLVPVFAVALVGYYIYDHLIARGAEITISFNSGEGLKPGQTQVSHLGVRVGQVTDIQISPDLKQVLVKVRLLRSQPSFARKGAKFWVVRPEISVQSITGLGTVLSGPYIDCSPGTGDFQDNFAGLEKAPVSAPNGLNITLRASSAEHVNADMPIYFRGLQVGVVQDVILSTDSTGVDVHAIIRQNYAPLVKLGSQFWIISGVDVKGGILTGVQMKVESLRTLISGGIGFATPEKDMGDQARDGAEFELHDGAKKDWLEWAPNISISPDDSSQKESGTSLPRAPQAIRSSVD